MNREPALEFEGMEIIALDSMDVHLFWRAWSLSVASGRSGDERPLKHILLALRELGLGDRVIPLMPNDDGRLVQANASPRGEFIADVAQLLDTSGALGDVPGTLDRLRRCPRPDCERFFDDPHRRARYCSADCGTAGRRELGRQRVRRHRDARDEQDAELGLDAPPRRCRSPRLRDPVIARERFEKLVGSGIPDHEAHRVLIAELRRVGAPALDD